MDRAIEQPFASALRALAVSRVLGDVRDQAGIEDRLAIVREIEPAIE